MFIITNVIKTRPTNEQIEQVRAAMALAIDLVGQTALAREIGASHSSPGMWRIRGSVPAEFCADIERATDGRVTRQMLHPHDWQSCWPELVLMEQKLLVLACIADASASQQKTEGVSA